MGYWKCKNCNNKYFYDVTTIETKKTEFDKDGNIENTYCGGTIEIIKVKCRKCGNEGKTLKEVANWEE